MSPHWRQIAGKPVIVGIDEAGRAPLAGPVSAAACVLPVLLFRRSRTWPAWSPFEDPPEDGDCIIADSKKLTSEQRETAYRWITAHCPYGAGMVGAEEIDRIGILAATEKAMQNALAQLEFLVTPTYLLVDGRDKFWFNYAHSAMIRGDEREPCIAAASIIAKVTRDRWMVKAAKEFATYGFERHKGYGTRAHFAALSRLGPCPLHRRTFLKAFSFQPTTPKGACRGGGWGASGVGRGRGGGRRNPRGGNPGAGGTRGGTAAHRTR